MEQETVSMELEIRSFADSGLSLEELYEFKQRNIGYWKARTGALSYELEAFGAYVNDILTPRSFQQVALMGDTIVGMILGRMTSTMGVTRSADAYAPLVDPAYPKVAEQLVEKQLEVISSEDVSTLGVLAGPLMGNTQDLYTSRGFEPSYTLAGYLEAEINQIQTEGMQTDLQFVDATMTDISDMVALQNRLSQPGVDELDDKVKSLHQQGQPVRCLRDESGFLAMIYLHVDDSDTLTVPAYVLDWEHEKVMTIGQTIFAELIRLTAELGKTRLKITRKQNPPVIQMLSQIGFEHVIQVAQYSKNF